MADFRPVNYGNILAQNEGIRGQQINNALAARQFDPNSPEYRLREAKILQLEREAAGGGANIGTTNPRDFTAESMARFEKSGDRNDLVRYETLIPQTRGGVSGVLDRRTGVWTAGEIGLDQETEAARKLKAAEREGILQTDLKFVPQIENMKVGAAQNAVAGLTQTGAPSGSVTAAENAGTIKSSETVAAGKASRGQEWINRGATAAEAYPVLGRALQLLEGGTETGGWDNAKLMASNFFGVTGADEAELSNNLGKAVLSQLRETFGAAFTVEEGRRLEGIEANYGKSTEGNKRLLQQAQKILNEVMKRGIKAAKDSGDDAAIEAINGGYIFDLSMPNDAPVTDDFSAMISAMSDEELRAIANQ